MWAAPLREKLEKIAEEVVTLEGFELVEAKVKLKGRRVVTFFIDKPDSSISTEDCARVSRLLEDAIDREDIVDGRYHLEVSSPGLDRVLRGEKDFTRFRGRRARVVTLNPVEGREFFEGLLGEVHEGTLAMELDRGEIVRIPLEEISAARLEVVF